MDTELGKDCGAFFGMFQHVINDMKGSYPVWEDFITKAVKLHSVLRSTVMATGSFLDAFQKVADLATSSKGATRDMGSALTRLCLRHRSIETKLKVFTSLLMEVLVNPLQDKMEEWKKNVLQLDKEHTKDYKKARAEIKRASSDTLRLQKKCKKGKPGQDLQTRLDSSMRDVTDKYLLLEETEKRAVRNALIEERSRFCYFTKCLKPIVAGEIEMLSEVTHLQEVLETLVMQAADPHTLPPSSEQLLTDIKGSDNQTWAYQTPPSSPSSLGSRKSSMCSINSITSSNSGSTTNSSPSHHFRNRASSQHLPPGVARLSSVSSQDSGFTSQDTLFMKPPSPLGLTRKSSLNDSSGGNNGGMNTGDSTPSPSYPSSAVSTWSNWPDPPGGLPIKPEQTPVERPHTISSAYEKNHSRPSITAQTFEPPEGSRMSGPPTSSAPQAASTPSSNATTPTAANNPQQQQYVAPANKINMSNNQGTTGVGSGVPSAQSHYAVPCVMSNMRPRSGSKTMDIKPPVPGPKPRARPVAPPMIPSDYAVPDNHIPVYVNQDDLAKMAGEMLKGGQDRGHDDIMEEDENEDEVTTPTPRAAQRSLASKPQEDVIEEAQEERKAKRNRDDLHIFNFDISDELNEITENYYARSKSYCDFSVAAKTPSGIPMSQSLILPSGNEASKKNDNSVDFSLKENDTDELALAIRELEASTAALELSCEQNQGNSIVTSPQARPNMADAGGFGMPNNTSVEDNTLADLDETLTSLDTELMELVEKSEHYSNSTLKRGSHNHSRSQSFRQPTTSRPQTLTGVSSGPTGTLRRSDSNLSQNGQKPPPPIRRNSSIQSKNHNNTESSKKEPPKTLPKAERIEKSAETRSKLENNGGNMNLRVCTNSVSGDGAPPAISPKPPMPPPSLATPGMRGSMSSDDSFDLPPPPPPEELEMDIASATAATAVVRTTVMPITSSQMTGNGSNNQALTNGAIETGQPHSVSAMTHIYETAGYNVNTNETETKDSSPKSGGSSIQRTGSIAEKHGNIINCLNLKLKPGQSQVSPPKGQQTLQHKPPSGSRVIGRHGQPPPVANKPKVTSPTRETDVDVTPTGDSPVSGTLLAQIQNGVKLRKSVSNDRSAPKL